MKVTSINSISEELRSSREGPGLKTQQDIANLARPREDISEVVFTKEDRAGLNQVLFGPDINRETLSAFIYNSLRSRPNIQEWLIQTGEAKGNIDWKRIATNKLLKSMNYREIAQMTADNLEKHDNILAIRVSLEQGIMFATTNAKPKGEVSLTIYYKPHH